MKNFNKLLMEKICLLVFLLLLGPLCSTVLAANVLVFGDSSGTRDGLATILTDQGHTVTNQAALPAVLTGFDTIYFASGNDLTSGAGSEQERLAAFLASGKGVHLNGEGGASPVTPNASFKAFVNTVVPGAGGNLDFGGVGNCPNATSCPYNPLALQNITTFPQDLLTLNGGFTSFPSVGTITGASLTIANVIASDLGGVATAAGWDETEVSGGGRLTVVMDFDWSNLPNVNSGFSRILAENIQNFLAFGPTAANIPPVADAGPDQGGIIGGDPVALDGTASSDSDGTIPATGYTWTQIAGTDAIVLTNPTSATPSFTAPLVTASIDEVYSFELVVEDDGGAFSNPLTDPNATVNIEILNAPPIADAGADASFPVFAVVPLNGSGSSDPEGQGLTYAWTQTVGPLVVLTGANTATPSFNLPNEANLTSRTFQLIVNDGVQDSVADTVVITTTNAFPIADAGADASFPAGSVASLNGSGSSDLESGPALVYSWTQITGPAVVLTGANTSSPTFPVPNEADGITRRFHLIVSDGAQSSGLIQTVLNTVTITTTNLAPTANAGADASFPAGGVANLDGTGSNDPENQALSFSWTQTLGPAIPGGLTGANTATPSFNVPNEANNTSRTFQLIVNDGVQPSVADTVVITTTNLPPVANAGADASFPAGGVANLDGSGSTGPESPPLSFSWTQTLGPAIPGGLTGANTATPSFNVPNEENGVSRTFQLTVDDGFNVVSTDEVVITTTNLAPIANAGPDQNPVLGGDLVTLDGTGSSDPEGQAFTYQWTQIIVGTEPVVALSSATAAQPTFTSPLNAVLTFQLVVDDGFQPSPPDTVVITAVNLLPIANAGPDQPNVFGGDVVTLDGSGSNDPESQTLTFLWTQTPVVAGVTLHRANTADPDFDAPVFDEDTDIAFQLTVNDGRNVDVTDEVIVTVKATNLPPVCNPADNVTTIGSPGINEIVEVNSLVDHLVSANDPNGDTLLASISPLPGPSLPGEAIFTPTDGTNPASASLSWEPNAEAVQVFTVTFTEDQTVDGLSCSTTFTFDARRFPTNGSIVAAGCFQMDASLLLEGFDNNGILREAKGIASVEIVKFIDGAIDPDSTTFWLFNPKCIRTQPPAPPIGLEITGVSLGDLREICSEPDSLSNNGCQTIFGGASPVQLDYDPISGDAKSFCYDLENWTDINGLQVDTGCNPFDPAFNPNLPQNFFDRGCDIFCAAGAGNCTGNTYNCDSRAR